MASATITVDSLAVSPTMESPTLRWGRWLDAEWGYLYFPRTYDVGLRLNRQALVVTTLTITPAYQSAALRRDYRMPVTALPLVFVANPPAGGAHHRLTVTALAVSPSWTGATLRHARQCPVTALQLTVALYGVPPEERGVRQIGSWMRIVRYPYDGVTLWQGTAASRREAVQAALDARVDLASADLRGENLRGLSGVNAGLVGAALDGAVHDGAVLEGAGLDGASASGVSARNVNFRSASMRGATLTNADVTGSDATGADTTGLDVADTLGAEYVSDSVES